MRASTKLMNKQKTSVANIKWQIRHKPQSRTAQVMGSHQNSTSSGNHSWFWRSLAQPATWSPVPSWTCEAPAAWSWLGERHIYASLASDFITHPLLWEYQIIWLSKDVASILSELCHLWTACTHRNSDSQEHGLPVLVGGSCPLPKGNVPQTFEVLSVWTGKWLSFTNWRKCCKTKDTTYSSRQLYAILTAHSSKCCKPACHC